MTTTILTGMHRSGTSLLARILHESGIPMGHEPWIPSPDHLNPDGYYEDYDFRELNDRLLFQAAKYQTKRWQVPVPLVTDATHATLHDMHRLVQKRCEGDGRWGFKDPRTCLTLSVWLEALAARPVHVILIQRDHDDVAKSLHRGHGVIEPVASQLWVGYNLAALEAVVEKYARFIVVSYDALTLAPESELQRLSTFIDHDLMGAAGVVRRRT